MVEVRKYTFPPTRLMPDSPLPLLHYVGLFTGNIEAGSVNKLLRSSGWSTKWLVRYGPNQKSHYHSRAHEAMVVCSGSARILFGVADLCRDNQNSEIDDLGQEEGGVEVDARAGDVFILPAGLAHKTYNPNPDVGFERLTPGDGKDVDEGELQRALEGIGLSRFTMMGSYAIDGPEWDFAIGGEDEGNYEAVWNVPLPELDPVLGNSSEGIRTLWKMD